MPWNGARAGSYEHLDESSPIQIRLPMPDLVRMVTSSNYGAHRFLSEFVKQRLAERPGDELAMGIESLLNQGHY
jgi:hypothetical protein